MPWLIAQEDFVGCMKILLQTLHFIEIKSSAANSFIDTITITKKQCPRNNLSIPYFA
jgi:hypothetical protein